MQGIASVALKIGKLTVNRWDDQATTSTRGCCALQKPISVSVLFSSPTVGFLSSEFHRTEIIAGRHGISPRRRPQIL